MRWRAAQHSALRHAPAGRAHRCPHASGTLETRAAHQERGGPCCGRSYPLPRGAPSEAKRARRVCLWWNGSNTPRRGDRQELSQRGRGSAARATALFPSPHGARLHTSGGRGSAVDSAEGRALGARQVRGEHGAAAAAWGPRSGGGAPRREPSWPSAKRPGVEDRAPALARRHGSPGRRTAAVHTSRTRARDLTLPRAHRPSDFAFEMPETVDPICRMVYSPRRVQ
jgi:hypothetical protein